MHYHGGMEQGKEGMRPPSPGGQLKVGVKAVPKAKPTKISLAPSKTSVGLTQAGVLTAMGGVTTSLKEMI